MTTELLTVPEAAERMRISDASMRRWLREGRVRGIKVGGAYRIPVGELPDTTSPTTEVQSERIRPRIYLKVPDGEEVDLVIEYEGQGTVTTNSSNVLRNREALEAVTHV